MVKTKAKILCSYCEGTLLGNQEAVVYDVKIDSREAKQGDMFVCIVGENNDGHKFAESSYQAGCRIFLMSNPNMAKSMIEIHSDACVILVDNTITALEKMAEKYLNLFSVRRVAVTGSVGKTTTKKMTAAVLSEKYNTVCTQKNLNTNIGLCLTAFMADQDTEFIVFEMGMDGKGQIDEYVSFIKPELAIITNVGVSHMERLGSRDNIASAKLEVVNQFTKENTLIVNSNSDYLDSEEDIRTRAINKEKYNIILCPSDLSISDIENHGEKGISFCYESNGDKQKIEIPAIGIHNVVDASLAITAGLVLGVSLSQAADALSKIESTDRRLNVEKINGVTLIDDSYNASPDSMKAGLAALSGFDGRKIAILSDMYELGDAEEEGHIDVGTSAADNGIDYLIAVGMNRRLYAHGVSLSKKMACNVIQLESKESAIELIENFLKDGDVVLVKGSNSTKISEVADYIRKLKK